MIDGRHTGTGGGNHVVVGGVDARRTARSSAAPTCSSRWCCTGSAIPSMSYLFSGLFIGPTSQAPRFDEARHDSLYELEIAMAQVPAPPGEPPVALAGRPPVPQPPRRRHRQHPPHRNLHRQALFARRPDRPARPRRVPRLRDAAQCAHEPRAAAAGPRPDRPLLDRRRSTAGSCAGARRSTTASCCRTTSGPTSSKCSPILADIGFDLDPEWFAAQLEFRFPFCGEVEYEGMTLTLNQALEPWHVMGEQGRHRRHRPLR